LYAYSRGVKVYKPYIYHQVDHHFGYCSGSGLDRDKQGIYEARIDEAIWDVNDLLMKYIMMDQYRKIIGKEYF
jgi:hypothetical protein